MRIESLGALVLVSAFLPVGCGSSNHGKAAARTPSTSENAAEATAPTSRPIETNAGSSDGKTCEDARAGYVEEMNVGQTGQQDLRAGDFAAVLNQGTYLEPCALPSATQLRICAAVQNGHAVGVTVASAPPSSEIEICVAKQVRNLSFPAHVKMDVVTVRF